jgi:GNAT superfamily N-acetyltransferase
MYQISEVDGPANEELIRSFNARIAEWPTLQSRHIDDGFWWVATLEDEPVAFAGLVWFEPCFGVGYLKRCFVLPDHHGHGLQYRLLIARELKAKQLGWTMLLCECSAENRWSAANFLKCGFQRVDPEQKWATPNDQYFAKVLSA